MSSQSSVKPLAQAPPAASKRVGRKSFIAVAGADAVDVTALKIWIIGMSSMPGNDAVQKHFIQVDRDCVWN